MQPIVNSHRTKSVYGICLGKNRLVCLKAGLGPGPLQGLGPGPRALKAGLGLRVLSAIRWSGPQMADLY